MRKWIISTYRSEEDLARSKPISSKESARAGNLISQAYRELEKGRIVALEDPETRIRRVFRPGEPAVIKLP